MVQGEKYNLDDYWSNDPLLKISSVASCMSRDRYKNILRLLHFSDNTIPAAYARLHRKGMPEFQNELQVGEREVLNNETTMALRWVDKRQVVMLTTQHNDQMIDTGKIDKRTKRL
ncbi:hypothetical protein J6590_041050 [Homalodisca vitripennis]|nr:hypothetical protein J6590_041050 [Homalodisca vitripennis]